MTKTSQLIEIKNPYSQESKIFNYQLKYNDDLISGNKFYKLRPFIKNAIDSNQALVSCGGAYSNHLHALAAAGLKYNIPTYGLVRAFEATNPTITMQDCLEMGMSIIPLTREQYKSRYDDNFLNPFQHIIKQSFLWIPEGGMDEIAIQSCEDIGRDLNALLQKHDFKSVYIAVGSGGTVAGIARSLDPNIQLNAVPTMKHWQDVKSAVEKHLTQTQAKRINWIDNASYGGFGKSNATHIEFLAHLENDTSLRFDPVYNSKVMRKLLELQFSNHHIKETCLLINTGGLQGRRSFQSALQDTPIDSDYFSKNAL